MKSQSLISFMGRVALAGALLLGVCTTAFAQQKISGTVLDASGQAVIGAGVVVEGTTNGVVVDLDGNWALTPYGIQSCRILHRLRGPEVHSTGRQG